MKFEEIELLRCKHTVPRSVYLLPVTVLAAVVLLTVLRNWNQPPVKIYPTTLGGTTSTETTTTTKTTTTTTNTTTTTEQCNLFSGEWVPNTNGLYYNKTCSFILDKLNCLMHGRSDTGYLHWRWKPDECELPLFNATQFLKLVEGKAMAFVGDSVGRNQMESLLCLLSTVARPEDITGRYKSKDDIYFKWWFYAEYNFTLTLLWSPFLVRSSTTYVNTSSNYYTSEKLYLDEPDEAWTREIEKYDFVIFSGGQWFFRPLTFYQNGQVVGCQKCNNSTDLDFYGYKHAFRTALRTIANLKGFKGLAFLVTQSPNHFESGQWNTGGSCNRTRPYTKEEKTQVHPYGLETLHQIQVEEFAAAEEEARKNGLHFGLIDVTDAMLMRPDGHPDKYGRSIDKSVIIRDCVHWCTPGAVDTWNEILLYMIRTARW